MWYLIFGSIRKNAVWFRSQAAWIRLTLLISAACAVRLPMNWYCVLFFGSVESTSPAAHEKKQQMKLLLFITGFSTSIYSIDQFVCQQYMTSVSMQKFIFSQMTIVKAAPSRVFTPAHGICLLSLGQSREFKADIREKQLSICRTNCKILLKDWSYLFAVFHGCFIIMILQLPRAHENQLFPFLLKAIHQQMWWYLELHNHIILMLWAAIILVSAHRHLYCLIPF